MRPLSTTMKYIQEIEALIENHKFEHFYLYKNLLNAISEQHEVNSKWKIGDNYSWILGICANGDYNIYGQNYTEELLEAVANQFDFDKLPNGIWFSGNKFIIDYLIQKNPGVYYERLKDRAFYQVNNKLFSSKSDVPKIEIRFANPEDLEILTRYNCQFFEEEYNGENNKDYDEMKILMSHYIDNETFKVATANNEVIGFCSRMKSVFNTDMIGTVFVNEKHRQSKVGTALITDMTEEILKNNFECWLMTDLNNIPSNRIMEKLKFKKIYEYTSGEVKKL